MRAVDTVTVTGGAGYLGSHLVRLLLQCGYAVRVIDNFTYGGQALRELQGHPRLSVMPGDICNIRDMVKVLKGSQAVVALAAIVGDPACSLSEEETLSVNYEATKILVELCNYHEVRRLLFASTCSVYGANASLLLNEGSRLNPVSLYARTRIMSEKVLVDSSGPGLVSTIFRLATLYGQSPRMRYDLSVNILSARALLEGRMQVFGGDQWRPFVHVQDAAEAFRAALEAEEDVLEREIYNVGSNAQNFQIGQVAEQVRLELPPTLVETQSSVADRRDYRVSFDKIENLLGFSPRWSMREGIREMLETLRRDPIDYQDDIYYNVKYLYRDLVPATAG